MTPEEFEAHHIGTWPPQAQVVHWDDRPGDPSTWVYVGRKGGGLFGNPFTPGRNCNSRRDAIWRFRRYFQTRIATDPAFKGQVESLRGKVLVCHCKPMDCHGDVIAEYLNSLP